MPYIFHNNHYFSLIDSTQKNGVFCQFFSSSYAPKPIQIQNQNCSAYCAHMDSEGNLYVATMPDAFHLNYHLYENNRFTKHTLVSNSTSNYHLSSPILYDLQNSPYLLYLSHQTHSTAYSFVQENLYHPQLTTLLTCYDEPQLIKHFIVKSQVFIFFVTFDEIYHVNMLHISPYQTTSSVFLNSSQPILDYSVCIDEDTIHMSYVAELHGKYQLNYFNNHSNHVTSLATSQYPCNPVVFCYYNLIWINAFINHKLQMIISIDDGETFSIPVPCSLQNNIHRCYFLTQKFSPFVGQEIYASITSTLKLCTLAMIDVPHFHPDSIIPPELELLLEGLMLTIDSVSNPSFNKVSEEDSLPSTPSSKAPHPPQSMEEAKNAFMNELTSWDLPPKL